eukprot:CAMPEP_0182882620 /NCGR_PEP_ID=MMETSP0034_2-20130328/17893_1 /TAXON_ID=156128 /ORGANISM="Nephroselmis pyriformis, Strain CCMP717" /LENGTH=418 /DNA_ID=CAMNT_0025015723 /DNA_START=12 /DNA_END=1265 /DNA_ORIENTATION=-
MGDVKREVQKVTVAKESELRLEIAYNKTVHVTLLSGAAEIFGAEIAVGQKVSLTGQKLAVYTYHGAQLEVDGEVDVMYVGGETPMIQYSNFHQMLEERRQQATRGENSGRGPRVMIVGPVDSGKSSLAKVLLNYGARLGHEPTFVDLDIGQGGITAPGVISASQISRPIDPMEGIPLEVPLVYWYGHITPSDNLDLYKFLVERMAGMLEKHCKANARAAAGGMVVNTMGWVEGNGYQLLLHAAEQLQVDTVVVLGQEKLYSQLHAHYQATSGGAVAVTKLGKSGGVVGRDSAYRKQGRMLRIKEYFYGFSGNLSPHSQSTPLEIFKVFRVGGGPKAPSSALPIGQDSIQDPLRVQQLPWGSERLHSVLAVSHAKTPEEILTSNVAGFIYVTEVDLAKGRVTYLSPCPGALPGVLLIEG